MDVLGDLKRWKPARLVAVLVEGTEVPIALGEGEGKWVKAVRALADVSWSSLRLLDGKGGLLRALVNDQAADPTDPTADDDDADEGGESVQLDPGMLFELKATREAVRAQRVALDADDRRTRALFDSQQKIIELLAKATRPARTVGGGRAGPCGGLLAAHGASVPARGSKASRNRWTMAAAWSSG